MVSPWGGPAAGVGSIAQLSRTFPSPEGRSPATELLIPVEEEKQIPSSSCTHGTQTPAPFPPLPGGFASLARGGEMAAHLGQRWEQQKLQSRGIAPCKKGSGAVACRRSSPVRMSQGVSGASPWYGCLCSHPFGSKRLQLMYINPPHRLLPGSVTRAVPCGAHPCARLGGEGARLGCTNAPLRRA